MEKGGKTNLLLIQDEPSTAPKALKNSLTLVKVNTIKASKAESDGKNHCRPKKRREKNILMISKKNILEMMNRSISIIKGLLVATTSSQGYGTVPLSHRTRLVRMAFSPI